MKYGTIILLMLFALLPWKAMAEETICRVFYSTIDCDDGTNYRVFNDTIYGPDGEMFNLPYGTTYEPMDNLTEEFDSLGSMNETIDLSDGTKIEVTGNQSIRVTYSEEVIKERQRKKEEREKQKKEFNDMLGISNPVIVNADGFFE